MVLSQKHLDAIISEEEQQNEIRRLKAAKVGDPLYRSTCKASDNIIDTLIHLAHIQYKVLVKGNEVRYVKG